MSNFKNLSAANLDYIRLSNEFVVKQAAGICAACGGLGPYTFAPIIKDALANEWELSDAEQEAFSSRESMFCVFCGCSYRLRALAKAIVLETSSNPAKGLEETIMHTGLEEYSIAEINSCGVLHDILRHCKNFSYSEYEPSDKSIEHQDLSSLTYVDEVFDIILDSDTLEHVPDPLKAFKEIYRVLKPGGKHIFTVPMRLNKLTKTRTKIFNGSVENLESPSYHGSGEPDYLVWNEFGADIIKLMEDIGFTVKLYFCNPDIKEDPSHVIVATKGKLKKLNYIRVDNEFGDAKDLSEQKIFKGFKLVSANIKTTFSKRLQIKKIVELRNKIDLTTGHVNNIEDINAAYTKEINNLAAHIKEVESSLREKEIILSEKELQLEKIMNTPYAKAYKSIRSLKKKSKRKG